MNMNLILDSTYKAGFASLASGRSLNEYDVPRTAIKLRPDLHLAIWNEFNRGWNAALAA